MIRLGIYGAGQLGAYLCAAARSLGLHTTVFAASPNDTAVSLADDAVVAREPKANAIAEFIAKSDVITFEMENVPVAVIRMLRSAAERGGVSVAPSIAALTLLQNKHSQKQWLTENDFPTAEFIDCPHGITTGEIATRLGLPFIQKSYRGGYDGKGVQLFERLDDDESLWTGAAIAEQYIVEKRELAVLVARSVSAESVVYPVVEMNFDGDGHVLRHALAPAPLGADLTERAQHLARNVVEQLDGVGLYAVEMFLTDSGELLINEIAPRVHNSGHLTLEANDTSQYEQHLRAILDLPLGSTEQIRPAAMVNLLQGDYRTPSAAIAPSVMDVQPDTFLYWYGKEGGARLRKMGHVTCLGDNLDAALRGAYETTTNVAVHLGRVA